MSSNKIQLELQANLEDYAKQLENDAVLQTQVHQMFAEVCDPYVPYITGALAGNKTIDENGITYNQPYAETVYDSVNAHNLEYHPLASSRWDDVAFENHKDVIEARATELAEKRLQEIIGNGR